MTVKENISLRGFNTFKVGGSARFFVEIKNKKDLVEVADFLEVHNLPFLVLGGGSNVLISDDNFPGLVLKISTQGIFWKDSLGKKIEVDVEAGVGWDELVSEVVKKNLFGLENLSGIPGTVGAAPIQNIGAYGAEVKNTIQFVEIFDLKNRQFKKLEMNDCRFGYRDSIFKSSESKNWIITSVSFLLSKEGSLNTSYKDLKNYFSENPNPTLAEVRQAVLEIRGRKFPDLKLYGTAGSFFKNPIITSEKFEELQKKFGEMPNFPAEDGKVKISAAWILDNVLKVKGKVFNNVSFFQNQPLVVVNLGSATASEIKEVTDKISLLAKKELGLDLEREVRLVGKF